MPKCGQEWWGITDVIMRNAGKLVHEGYRCLIPDLYKGKIGVDKEEAAHVSQSSVVADTRCTGLESAEHVMLLKPFDCVIWFHDGQRSLLPSQCCLLDFQNYKNSKRTGMEIPKLFLKLIVQQLMGELDFKLATDELTRAVEYLRETGSPTVGCVGFCMGGALAFCAAQHSGLDCAAPFYGTPNQSICDPGEIKIPLQAHFGKLDSLKGFSDLAVRHKMLTSRFIESESFATTAFDLWCRLREQWKTKWHQKVASPLSSTMMMWGMLSSMKERIQKSWGNVGNCTFEIINETSHDSCVHPFTVELFVENNRSLFVKCVTLVLMVVQTWAFQHLRRQSRMQHGRTCLASLKQTFVLSTHIFWFGFMPNSCKLFMVPWFHGTFGWHQIIFGYDSFYEMIWCFVRLRKEKLVVFFMN